MNRRSFLATSACVGATLGLGARSNAMPQETKADTHAHAHKRIKIGVATYSYWHFMGEKAPIESIIDKAGDMGVEALDLLHRQMDIPEKDPLTPAHRARLQKLKRHAFRNGVTMVCFSTHQTFLSPDPAKVTENVEHTKKCIEICYELGIPCMRVNTGRWGTIDDFDELMKHKGVEPMLPGHNEEEAFKWVIDGIERCLDKAAQCGVILALENHWGLARTPEGQMRILNSIDSPWFGALMDTGNFLEAPYKEAAYNSLKMIAPKTVYVQAKTYYGGGVWYELDIDYERVARILKDAGYSGYCCLEFEGKEDPDIAVPRSIALLRKTIGA
jgi:sugar phosphate isomerase/epimerase